MLKKCSERNVFALCRFISRRNYPPRFVALLPQNEELGEGKVQITPPGNVVLGSRWLITTSESLQLLAKITKFYSNTENSQIHKYYLNI